MMVSALRVGHSLIASLGAVAQDSREPISGEFASVSRKQNYGVSLRTALVNLTRGRLYRIFVSLSPPC